MVQCRDACVTGASRADVCVVPKSALITASATRSPFSLAHGSARRTEGSRGERDRCQERGAHRPRRLPAQARRRGRAVRTCEKKGVPRRPAGALSGVVEPPPRMMAPREGPGAPCHMRPAALEPLRAPGRVSLQRVWRNRPHPPPHRAHTAAYGGARPTPAAALLRSPSASRPRARETMREGDGRASRRIPAAPRPVDAPAAAQTPRRTRWSRALWTPPARRARDEPGPSGCAVPAGPWGGSWRWAAA